jgi:hypothetical protein
MFEKGSGAEDLMQWTDAQWQSGAPRGRNTKG